MSSQPQGELEISDTRNHGAYWRKQDYREKLILERLEVGSIIIQFSGSRFFSQKPQRIKLNGIRNAPLLLFNSSPYTDLNANAARLPTGIAAYVK